LGRGANNRELLAVLAAPSIMPRTRENATNTIFADPVFPCRSCPYIIDKERQSRTIKSALIYLWKRLVAVAVRKMDDSAGRGTWFTTRRKPLTLLRSLRRTVITTTVSTRRFYLRS
jgi:hypothetical protein